MKIHLKGKAHIYPDNHSHDSIQQKLTKITTRLKDQILRSIKQYTKDAGESWKTLKPIKHDEDLNDN